MIFPHGRAEPIPNPDLILGLIPLVIRILFKCIYTTQSYCTALDLRRWPMRNHVMPVNRLRKLESQSVLPKRVHPFSY